MKTIKEFFENAKSTWKKLIIFSIIVSVLIGTILLICCGLYKTQKNEKETLTNESSLELNSEYTEAFTIQKQEKEREQEDKIDMIKLKVNNRELEVRLEENEATKKLVEKLKNGDITVKANEYGGFEKVGNLGFSLPQNDTHINTSAGDIVLYQGNQISLFYNSNSWNYTRIGKIQNVSESELKNILGKEDVDIILCLN